MSLFELLACPLCKADVALAAGRLQCSRCGRTYPIVNGVPVMLADPALAESPHESQLAVHAEYGPWVHRSVLQSLTDDQVCVDLGSGNMALDDPCIIRLDSRLSPYVDIVADLHALPFRADSLAFVFSLAVLEHVRQPFAAAAEMYRVLKPGGYVYGECSFVFAYHGYPHHYFNASLDGLRQVFAQFRHLRSGVAPYQAPSFALTTVLSTYLNAFRPATAEETRFAALVKHVLDYPLQHYDARIAPTELYRVAAGGYFYGVKDDGQGASVLPAPVLAAHRRDPALQADYPCPRDLSRPDNLMTWARTEGRDRSPEIAAWLQAVRPFSKYADPARPINRSWIRALPPTVDPEAVHTISQPDHTQIERRADESLRGLLLSAEMVSNVTGSSKLQRAGAILRLHGPGTLARRSLRYLRRRVRQTGQSAGLIPARPATPPAVGPDGLPLPPGDLVHLVVGTEDVEWYIKSGRTSADNIRRVLVKNSLALEKFRAVLDFGCGSGRIMRHWKDLAETELHGTDRNPALVAWCRQNLRFAQFAVNPLVGRLAYESAKFDFIYAFSVFTHLTEGQQLFWIEELSRILRPGGYLYLTTHGEAYLPQIPEELQPRFRNGQLVVCGAEHAGENMCAAFHPETYVRARLAHSLTVVDFLPGEFPQDVYLLRKPE
jgi:ubiquinone/menaquinone biosynthesis C-methylase UbiE/uncharacterized protein YbaR (Trm112 family)